MVTGLTQMGVVLADDSGFGQLRPMMEGRSFLVGGTAVGERRQVNHTTRPHFSQVGPRVSLDPRVDLLPAAFEPLVQGRALSPERGVGTMTRVHPGFIG